MNKFQKVLFDKVFKSLEEDLNSQFKSQILISERKRVSIIIMILLFIILMVTILGQFSEMIFKKYPTVRYDIQYSYYVLFGFLGIELLARFNINKIINERRTPPEIFRYLNALIETSLPTAAILNFYHSGTNPIDALISPIHLAFFFFIILSTMRLSFGICIFTALIAATEYSLLIYYFESQGILMNSGLISGEIFSLSIRVIFFLVSGLLAGLVSMQIKQSFLNSIKNIEERKQLVNIFGQHVSPAVVDKLLSQNIELVSETKYVCILFLDIRNFTKFSEEKTPVEVVNYLNNLFQFMIEIINRNHGIINKFLGDGFLAVFGAPISNGEDCANAIRASREILQTVHKYNEEGKILPTRLGIGIHSGEAVTGNVGSEIRKEYTIIGDVVNLASRIEQLNKEYGTEILFSSSVSQKLPEDFLIREIDSVRVKGRLEPVTIYSLVEIE